MKIKTKKQLSLPQLIEWAWENPKSSRNKRFVSENKSFPWVKQYVIFNEVGYAEIENSYCYGRNDLFTVEVEEEITKDTEIQEMLLVFNNGVTHLVENRSLNYLDTSCLKSAYTMNDDLRLILIWRDGKLVE